MIELHLRGRASPGRRSELVEFLREAILFYESPAGIRVRVLWDLADQDRFVEVVEYIDRATYERDQARVVAGRLVGHQQRRVGRDRAGDGDPLLLSAGELPRIVVHPVGQARRPPGRPRTCSARSLRLSRVSISGSSTFSYAVSTGIRL